MSLHLAYLGRTEDDCTVAVVATVMGPPYTYERVLADRSRYRVFNNDGSFSACWETYLWDSGFPNEYRPLGQLPQLVRSGAVVGILMLAPRVKGIHFANATEFEKEMEKHRLRNEVDNVFKRY